MLESLDLYKQVSNKPVQPHQKRSIIGGKSVKYFEFGIADYFEKTGRLGVLGQKILVLFPLFSISKLSLKSTSNNFSSKIVSFHN
jgi:hypothetical protein